METAIKIRVTSVFILLAVSIYLVVNRKWKMIRRLLIPFLCGIAVGMLLYAGIYRVHVDFDTSESRIPVWHFLMMGSHDLGAYSQGDVEFTRNFSTYAERSRNTRNAFWGNLRSMGVKGAVKLGKTKIDLFWPDGQKWYSGYIKNVEKESACHEFLMGDRTKLFPLYMQGYNSILFCFIALSCLIMLCDYKCQNRAMFIMAVYMAGCIVFYLFWEMHTRHGTSLCIMFTFFLVPMFKRWMDLLKNKFKI